MSLTIIYPQEAVQDNKLTTEIVTSVAKHTLSALSEEENQNLPVASSFAPANTLEDRLAFDRKIIQFVLSESEAAFTSPVRHFFTPGGQQLHYNHR